MLSPCFPCQLKLPRFCQDLTSQSMRGNARSEFFEHKGRHLHSCGGLKKTPGKKMADNAEGEVFRNCKARLCACPHCSKKKKKKIVIDQNSTYAQRLTMETCKNQAARLSVKPPLPSFLYAERTNQRNR